MLQEDMYTGLALHDAGGRKTVLTLTSPALAKRSVRSRSGYIKIVLDKSDNTPNATAKLKATGEGLKKILSSQLSQP